MARPDNDNTSVRKLNLVGAKSYAVSIPIEVVRQLKWNKGDTVTVRRIGDKLMIERKED